VQRVADVLGEVDDRVAAHDEVVAAARKGHAQQVALLEADKLAQGADRSPGAALERLEVAVQQRRRAVRASSALNSPVRARATMRRSRSVPTMLTVALGTASRQTAASVNASAP